MTAIAPRAGSRASSCGQRPAGRRRVAAIGADDHAPVRCGKPVWASRQLFWFAVVGRHSPIVGPRRPCRNARPRAQWVERSGATQRG